MFSGIVQATSQITHVLDQPNLKTFSVHMDKDFRNNMAIGASVAIDGVCMTVVKIEGNDVYFDAMQETLTKTTTSMLEIGSLVNIERSIKFGDEIGGHPVSGHVHGKGRIINIDKSLENNCVISLQIPEVLIKYTFDKGFIALNGASLTIVDVDRDKNVIRVSLIPETLRQTTFSNKKINDEVNIEIEQQTQTIVDTVEKTLANKQDRASHE